MHACIGEGNGNPLQCSCLENPRAGGAWWAAVGGVAQSQTRLKRLSSSSAKGLHFETEQGHVRELVGSRWPCSLGTGTVSYLLKSGISLNQVVGDHLLERMLE